MMDNLGIDLRQTLEPGLAPELVHKLMGRLRLANFMDLPETDFRDFVREIETDPLFRRFCFADDRSSKLIGFRRFPRGDLARGNVFELNEEITPQSSSVDVESLIESRREIVAVIRSLGMERFREYFLYPEEDITLPEIAARCSMPEERVRQITDLVNSVFIHHEISSSEHGPSRAAPEKQVSYSKIASIETVDGKFAVGFTLPAFARGRYVINYDRFEELKKNHLLDGKALHRVRSLLKKLEMINARKNLLYKTLETAVVVQKDYLETGDPRQLKPFLLKDLAAVLNVSLGMVSRAIQGKSVGTPWGERPVRFFFPSRKAGKKELVREVISEEGKPYSDEQIRRIILDRHGVEISRRAINVYRRSMNIDSSYSRRNDRPADGRADPER